jgi:sortase A
MRAKPRARIRFASYALRCVEGLLFTGGMAALVYCASAGLRVYAADRAAAAFTENTGPSHARADATAHRPSDVMGRIQIPALGLSAPITAGVGRIELIEGVGHIPGTALAGGLGTMGLAGHRDTFFRALKRISPGMQIRVTGESGTYRYVVDTTKVIFPEQVEVLDAGSRPKLVLVTCYPFHYIGAAPQRFVVQAHLLSVLPDNGAR